MTQWSDEELVRRFQGGDSRAFEQLVERHQDRIYRLATAMLESRHDAADAAQEVFLRAYEGLPRFRFHAAPFTWLYRTLRHVCNEFNRRRGVIGMMSRRMGASTGAISGASEPAIDDHAAAGLDAELRLRRVLRRIAELPPRQRDVVLLRVFEGLSIEETARALGCRPGTVKAQLNRGLARLKSLERHHDGEDRP